MYGFNTKKPNPTGPIATCIAARGTQRQEEGKVEHEIIETQVKMGVPNYILM